MFLFTNVAAKIFKIVYVACILFLLDSADLVVLGGKKKNQNKEPKSRYGLYLWLLPSQKGKRSIL